jgi:hypothetical protein
MGYRVAQMPDLRGMVANANIAWVIAYPEAKNTTDTRIAEIGTGLFIGKLLML